MAMYFQPQTCKTSDQHIPILSPNPSSQSLWYSCARNARPHAKMVPSLISCNTSQSFYENLHSKDSGSMKHVIMIIIKYMILSINLFLYVCSYWKPLLPYLNQQYHDPTTCMVVASLSTSSASPSTKAPFIISLTMHQKSSMVTMSFPVGE